MQQILTRGVRTGCMKYCVGNGRPGKQASGLGESWHFAIEQQLAAAVQWILRSCVLVRECPGKSVNCSEFVKGCVRLAFPHKRVPPRSLRSRGYFDAARYFVMERML